MNRRRAGWRLAWRLVRAAPARSLLIAVLVALPVVVGTFVAVAYRTAQLSPAQAADRYLGHADAIAVVTPMGRLDPVTSGIGRGPSYSGETVEMSGPEDPNPSRDATSVDLVRLLPAGAHAVAEQVRKSVVVSRGSRSIDSIATVHDFTDAIGQPLYRRVSGRLPVDADQVAVTKALAHRMHLHPGDALVVDHRALTVTAVVRNPSSLSAEEVVGAATAFGGLEAFKNNGFAQEVTWLIGFHGKAPDLHVAMARLGVMYETRAQWEHPSYLLQTSISVNPESIAILVSVGFFGVMEIVLLAGTAVAVGARRQVRELALLRAVGGDESDVRRAVLAQGVILGAAGGVLGVIAGAGAAFVARPVLEHFVDRAFGPFDVPWAVTAAVMAGAVVAALLAAIIPARTTARLAIVDMAKMRFPADGLARNPIWAWVALAAGPVVIAGAAVGFHHTASGRGSYSDAMWTSLISVGAAIALAGLARTVPMLLTRAARRSARLPLGPRLALRDAARHWHRSAPAAAAVATIVAGTVLVLFVTSSTDVRGRKEYQPSIPPGLVAVSVTTSSSAASLAAAAHQVQVSLHAPPGGVFSLVMPQGPKDADSVDVHGTCSGQPVPQPGTAGACPAGTVGVTDAAGVTTLAGGPAPAALRALAEGGAIAFDPSIVHGGRVTIEIVRDDPAKQEQTATTLTLPATLVPLPPAGSIPSVVVSASTAAAHRWTTEPQQALLRPRPLPSDATLGRLRQRLGTGVSVYAERGYHSRLGLVLLLLLTASAMTALAGTSIAVALAMAESRNDMATLAAVGASPARRRVHAMSHAAAISGLGCALGLPLGVLVGVALIDGSTSYPFSFPARWLVLLAVIVPLLGVAVAGAATRSRISLTRRLT